MQLNGVPLIEINNDTEGFVITCVKYLGKFQEYKTFSARFFST